MRGLKEKIEESRRFLADKWNGQPIAGVILGTGLGGFAEEIKVEKAFPYEEIPHFPVSTSPGHSGQLLAGQLAGVPIIAMEGRFHFYEGYSMAEVTFPVRVMKALGCQTLIVSNACGGLNPQFSTGDIMIIDDHINLMGDNPLRGVNDDTLGPRFPDMCRPYCPELVKTAMSIAMENRIVAHKGVYVAVAGPNLETRAEYRFLRGIGSDVVGMSTVPEVIVAVHARMRCVGLSVITDMCLADALEPAELETILRIAAEAEPKVRTLVRGLVNHLAGRVEVPW